MGLTNAKPLDTVPNDTENHNEEAMATEKIASLIPNAKTYIKHGFNVLLIGPAGTGKTESVRDIASQFGLKVKSYSCATLDPFTDLVGVPVPQKDEKTGRELLLYQPRLCDHVHVDGGAWPS